MVLATAVTPPFLVRSVALVVAVARSLVPRVLSCGRRIRRKRPCSKGLDVLRAYKSSPVDVDSYAAALRQGGYAALVVAGAEETSAMSPKLRKDIDVTRPMTLVPSNGTCDHVGTLEAVRPGAQGCEDCLRVGAAWVHLRLCMQCGHVGCCDSSPNRHASTHFRATAHPIVRSLEPGEDWGWCYEDEVML